MALPLSAQRSARFVRDRHQRAFSLAFLQVLICLLQRALPINGDEVIQG